MAEPPKNGTDAPQPAPPAAAQDLRVASAADDRAEFAALPKARTRHPALAIAAAALALFLVAKMRDDIAFALSPRAAPDLGEARALFASERGRQALADGVNRLVVIRGTPDRESALHVDTKGSWTFTQLCRILGTDSRLFVHRREDPLPAFRAERDAFEGRLIRFSDLSFADSIHSYFAGHVTATHFFRAADVRRAAATLAGAAPGGGGASASAAGPIELGDLAGDKVALGPNDVLAVDMGRPGEIEVLLPATRFPGAAAARAALTQRGAEVLRPGRDLPERQSWVIAVPAEGRDRLLDAVGNIDREGEIREVRETVKVRLADLVPTDALGAGTGAGLAVRGGATPQGDAGNGGSGAAAARPLTNIRSIRTLASVQIPPDAYLIVEADYPRDHLPKLAIAAVLLVFAAVNLVALVRGRKRERGFGR
jgi:hypothetical protein